LTLERRCLSINLVPVDRIDSHTNRPRRFDLAAALGQMPRALALVLLAPSAIILSACVIKPFNVKTRPAAPPGEFRSHATAGTVELGAGIIRDEDYLYDRFDANLILAGVLPVKFSAKNTGPGPMDLKPVRIWLVASGHGQRPMEARSAFKRLMKYYRIRAYSPDGYKSSVVDFVSYGFDSGTPLAPGELRWGLLFFQTPSNQPPGSGLVLRVKGISPTDLMLNVDPGLRIQAFDAGAGTAEDTEHFRTHTGAIGQGLDNE
jgi:hypothetical protein